MADTGPRTRGEEEQLNKLKRFSDSRSEIDKVRGRLEKAGYGQQPEQHDKRADRGPILYSNAKHAPKRREEDQDAFILSKPGFFASLFSILFKKSDLMNDPNSSGRVKKGLAYLIKYKCAFVLDDNVISFVSDYILKWQLKLRPLLELLQRQGWRSEDGRRILDPEEYNLLSVSARLGSNHKMKDIARHRYNTVYLYSISNSFIYLYYQIVRFGADKLLKAVQNALYAFIAENPKKNFPHSPENYVNAVKDFFDGRIETDFIIPLIEAVTGTVKSREIARAEAKIGRIDQNNYKANAQMHSLMKAREESYAKKKTKIERMLGDEVAFLDQVLDDLDYTYPINSQRVRPVELAFLIMEKFLQNRKHVVRELFAAINFFMEYYRSLLTINIPAREQARIEYIVLFNQDVFAEKLNRCIKLTNSLKPLINNPHYENFIEEADAENVKKLEFATTVGEICDIFMDIAEVLVMITTPSSLKKKASRPIEVSTLERFTLPFPAYHIIQESNDPKKEEIYSINGKTIENVISEIRIFCFSFIRYFEPEMELKDSQTIPRRTLYSRIRKNRKYKDFLARLKNEENIKLPASIGDL